MDANTGANISAKDIISKKFEMVLRGYKTEEVEDFLREVYLEFSRIQKEKDELETKLEVLADKIREYREDEDTLKDALLGAQRQGNALIADSKRKAAEIIETAQSNSDEILRKAEENRQRLKEKGDKEIETAKEEARNIIKNAKEKAAEIEHQMNLRTDVQKEILHRTSGEVEGFKQRIVSAFKEQICVIEKIAKDCENEFITNALKEKRPDFKQDKPQPQQNKQEQEPNNSNNSQKNKNRKNKSKSDTRPLKDDDDTSDESVRFEVDLNENVDSSEKLNKTLSLEDNADNFDSVKDKTGDIFFKKKQEQPRNKNKNKLHFGADNNDK